MTVLVYSVHSTASVVRLALPALPVLSALLHSDNVLLLVGIGSCPRGAFRLHSHNTSPLVLPALMDDAGIAVAADNSLEAPPLCTDEECPDCEHVALALLACTNVRNPSRAVFESGVADNCPAVGILGSKFERR